MSESSKKKRQPVPQRKTRAQENRLVRQEAIREQLAAQKLVEGIDKNINRLEKIQQSVAKKATSPDMARAEIQAIKVQIDSRFKKLDKVLPDAKPPADPLEAGMLVSINMNFGVLEGQDPVDVMPQGDIQEPPPSKRPKLPPVIVIGKQ